MIGIPEFGRRVAVTYQSGRTYVGCVVAGGKVGEPSPSGREYATGDWFQIRFPAKKDRNGEYRPAGRTFHVAKCQDIVYLD